MNEVLLSFRSALCRRPYHLRMASQLSSTAAIVVATSVVSASTGGKDLTTVDIISKNDAQDVHKVDVSLNQPLDIGEECNTFISIENKDEEVVDVGVLEVGCENNNEQECRKDETSTLGGRCTTSKDTDNVLDKPYQSPSYVSSKILKV